MEKDFKIKLAIDNGLTYTGNNNEDGEPEFIGTEKQWDNFNESLEGDRLGEINGVDPDEERDNLQNN